MARLIDRTTLFTVMLAASAPVAGQGALLNRGASPWDYIHLIASGAQDGAITVTGAPNAPTALNLTVPADGLRFLRFHQIPSDFRLSQGFRVGNSWIVSVFDLNRLELIAPPGFTGSVTLDIAYYRDSQGGAVAQQYVKVEIKQPSVAEKAPGVGSNQTLTAAIAPPDPNGATESQPDAKPGNLPPSHKPAVPAAQEAIGLSQAAKLLHGGDVAAARLVFEDLASRGSARGALALGETFDPAFLRGIVVAGLRPDIEMAKKWYQRAAELGHSAAATRISELEGN